MIAKLVKSIVKKFASADVLAQLAADKIADAANKGGLQTLSDKGITEVVKTALDIQNKIGRWIEDGKIDDIEKSEIAEVVKPLMQKVIDLI